MTDRERRILENSEKRARHADFYSEDPAERKAAAETLREIREIRLLIREWDEMELQKYQGYGPDDYDEEPAYCWEDEYGEIRYDRPTSWSRPILNEDLTITRETSDFGDWED